MPTAYIDITIEPRDRGATLFQIECAAEVEYQTEGSELRDWHISNFRFDEYASRWSPSKGAFVYAKVDCRWAKDTPKLFSLLLPFVDMKDLEAKLIAHLAQADDVVAEAATQQPEARA